MTSFTDDKKCAFSLAPFTGFSVHLLQIKSTRNILHYEETVWTMRRTQKPLTLPAIKPQIFQFSVPWPAILIPQRYKTCPSIIKAADIPILTDIDHSTKIDGAWATLQTEAVTFSILHRVHTDSRAYPKAI